MVIYISIKGSIMEKLYQDILEYKSKNKFSTEDCANNLGISFDDMKKIESGEVIELTKKDESRIVKVIEKTQLSTGKRVVKVMDLIFRFVAMVMSLVTLLLSINENVDTKVLVVLLSIGLVCSTMTILPKIEK